MGKTKPLTLLLSIGGYTKQTHVARREVTGVLSATFAEGHGRSSHYPDEESKQERDYSSPKRAMPQAGANAPMPRSQYRAGGDAFVASFHFLTTPSVRITPRIAAEEERTHHTSKGLSGNLPVKRPSRPRKAMSQAGRIAASPKSQ